MTTSTPNAMRTTAADWPADSPRLDPHRKHRGSVFVSSGRAAVDDAAAGGGATIGRARSKSVFVGGGGGSVGVGSDSTNAGGSRALLSLARLRLAASGATAAAIGAGGADTSEGTTAAAAATERADRDRSMSIVGGTSALTTSDVNRLRKQTYELTSGGVSGAISAKKLWRSGMLRLFSLRNAFDLKEKGIGGDDDSHSSGPTSVDPSETHRGSSRRPPVSHSPNTPLHARDDYMPTQSWDSMMAEFKGLNALHQARFEGKSATITLRESLEEENRWYHHGEVGSGLYTYLHLPLVKSKKHLINQLRFQIQPLNASSDDLELYVCCTNKQPTRNKHSWKLGRMQKLLILSKHDPKFNFGNGHFYIGVYGFGKNVTMMTYALRIQASEDTFVPYSQLLAQAGTVGSSMGPLTELNRETTAKNRLANKLNALKHNRAAFDNFQRKVQTIIETRMAAAHAIEEALATKLDVESKEGGKKQINYVVSNKIHTEISLHSPRALKQMLYSSMLRKPPPPPPIEQEDGQIGSQVDFVDGQLLNNDEFMDGDSGDVDADAHLHPYHRPRSVDVDSNGRSHSSRGASIGDDDDHLLDDGHNGGILVPVNEEADDTTVDDGGGGMEELLNEAAAAIDAQDAETFAALLMPATPTQHATPTHLQSNISPASNRPIDTRRPSSIKVSNSPISHSRASSHSLGSGAPIHSPQSGASATFSRRPMRKSSVVGSVGAGVGGGFQVPLTPVNLHLHDLLTARDDDEESRMQSARDDSGLASLSLAELSGDPFGAAWRRSSSATARRPPPTLQQQAAEKLRRLSKEHTRSEAALILQHAAALAAAAASDGTDRHSPSSASSPTAHPMSVDNNDLIGLASIPMLDSVPEVLPAGEEIAIGERDSIANGVIDSTGVEAGPDSSLHPSPAAAHSPTAITSPIVGTLDLQGLDSVSQQDILSPSVREDDLTVGSQSESQSASASVSGRGSAVHGRRRGRHSRATSFFTEVSTAPSGGSGDTYAALESTVAEHAAKGGTFHGTGRKWIRMPFSTPKGVRRRVGGPNATHDRADSAAPSPDWSTSHPLGGSQTARDSKQPVRGSLQSRKDVTTDSEELAAKSALLRQTVENNLKLTQVALHKKRGAMDEDDTIGIKVKFSPALSSMVETHGAMASNQYETTQAAHRQMNLRRNNPAKWMGRNFAVRNLKHGPDSTAPPGRGSTVAGESPYLSSTSKTHRIKLELAYLHRTTTKPKNKEKNGTNGNVSSITGVAAPVVDPVAPLTPVDDAASVSVAPPGVVHDPASTLTPPLVPEPDPYSKSASSMPSSPNLIARVRAMMIRTSSLPPQSTSEEFHLPPTKEPVASVNEADTIVPESGTSLVAFQQALIDLALPAASDSPLSPDKAHVSDDKSPSVSANPVEPSQPVTPTASHDTNTSLATSSPSSNNATTSRSTNQLQRTTSLAQMRETNPSHKLSVVMAPFPSSATTPTVVVDPLPSKSTSSPPHDDILQLLQSDPYWQTNFFSLDPVSLKPLSNTSFVQPVLPVDKLSQVCLCIDFATRQKAALEKTANKLEDAIVTRMVAQHTLLLDRDAEFMTLPILPSDHPIRDHTFFLTHPLPSIVRWSPIDAQDHASLTHVRTQVKRFEYDLSQLYERFEKENLKLDRIKIQQREERNKKKQQQQQQQQQSPDLSQPHSTASLHSYSDRSHSHSHTSSKAKLSIPRKEADLRRREQFGLMPTRSQALLLPIKPNSAFAQQLIASGVSPTTIASIDATQHPSDPLDRDSPTETPIHAASPSSPVVHPPADASPVIVGHVSRPTSQSATPSTRSPTQQAHQPNTNIAIPNMSLIDDCDVDATAATHLAPKTLHDWQSKESEVVKDSPRVLSRSNSQLSMSRPATREHQPHSQPQAQPHSQSLSGRRSSFTVRGGLVPPTAAEQLYGSMPIAPPTRSPTRFDRRPAASILSPRTRRLVQSAADELAQEEVDQLPITNIKRANVVGSNETKEENRKSASSTTTSNNSNEAGVGNNTARKRAMANTTGKLASSFTRLTRALSNATIGVNSCDASPSSSTGAVATDSSPSPSGVSSVRLARQIRLAKYQHNLCTLARDLRSDRAAELRHLAATARHEVICQRGLSQAFAAQLTPVLNADQTSAFDTTRNTHTHTHGTILDDSFRGPYGGVTSTAYDARHLSHHPHASLRAASKLRFSAAHWREDSLHIRPESILHLEPDEAERSFKDTRLIYAKLNYINLDRIDRNNEAEREP